MRGLAFLALLALSFPAYAEPAPELAVPGFEMESQPAITPAPDAAPAVVIPKPLPMLAPAISPITGAAVTANASPPAPVAAKPDNATCAVSNDQIPPEFMNLMNKLDEPATTTDAGLPPVVEQLAPAAVTRVATPAGRTAVVVNTGRRTEHGVQILNGNAKPQLGQSRENGVTVYRGLSPAGR